MTLPCTISIAAAMQDRALLGASLGDLTTWRV
jgi:hypothetical protein